MLHSFTLCHALSMPRLYIEPTFASEQLRRLFAGGRPAGDRVCSDIELLEFSTFHHARRLRSSVLSILRMPTV